MSIREGPLRLLTAAGLLALAGGTALSAPRPGGTRPPHPAVARAAGDLLFARCAACHGKTVQRGGLRLDRPDLARRGGQHGAVLVPGRPEASELLRRVTARDPARRMPPAGEALRPEEAAVLRRWIAAGAPPWPAAASMDTGGHWAFRPVTLPAVPRVHRTAHAQRAPGRPVRSPLDAFVLARLEAAGIAPAPEADSRTLVRRLCLDLTGLPPAPEEVEAFARDRSPGAYDRLVERLLASPHFGERWGRHWLDLARYADTDGYGPDRLRPYAWRWRDWVIDALNRDMPFDRFTVAQVAGDLLPAAAGPEALALRLATGFHRNTLSNREAGADQEESRTKAVADRVNTVGTAWLGLTVGCAECHDHKYDPLTQRDYYRLYALFNNADEEDLAVPPTAADRAVYESARRAYVAYLQDLESDLDAYRTRLRANLPEQEARLRERGDMPAAVAAILAVAPAARTAAQTEALVTYCVNTDDGFRSRKSTIDDHRRTEPRPGEARAYILAERADARRATAIHVRGDFRKPGEAVEPGAPGFLYPLRPRGSRADRLDLARWLVDPENPLTARVQVNRVWQHLFGQGLVPTPEDFGTRGDPPSHPELLDYLAHHFSRGDPGAGVPAWSLKALIRAVVTSATYRQSSRLRPELRERDPKNRLLARQNRFRLEAEAIRDVALASGGLLNRRLGGPSFRPPLPAGVTEVAFRLGLSYTPDTGDELYRRSVYLFVKRNLLHPLLTTFDAPDAASSCTRRTRTNTPLQALALLNDPAFLEAARALAARAAREAPAGGAARADRIFRLCVGRPPDAAEQRVLARLLADLRGIYTANPAAAAVLAGEGEGPAAVRAAWIALARTALNLDAAMTRE